MQRGSLKYCIYFIFHSIHFTFHPDFKDTKMRKQSLIFTLAIVVITSNYTWGQSTNIPLNKDVYHNIDRYEVLQGKNAAQFFTNLKPYKRSDVVDFFNTQNMEGASRADQFNKDYYLLDSWEWDSTIAKESKNPIFKTFYKAQSDFLKVEEKDFDLHINPVLHFYMGKDNNQDYTTTINSRGVELRGMIGRKLGFYSYLTENQITFPDYVNQYTNEKKVIPQEGFWKPFKTNGKDFFTARGYISFEAIEYINIQFGHDRHFIGNGYRSLILSDQMPSSLFLKFNTKVWKIKYTNLFTQMTADVPGGAGGLPQGSTYPNKYSATHHLAINIGKKFNLALFESVIFGPKDSTSVNGFKLEYLNPIIFYRALEHQNGSADNVIIGMDMKWNVIKKVQLYGQLVLDEFKLDEIKSGEGWWANKFGIQAGAKYYNAFGIDNLDLQGEINIARPYTYSHNTQYTNYAHFQQSMAHPMGANFKEMVGIIRYQPIRRLQLTAKAFVLDYGLDGADENWGGNVLKDNNTREMEYGNKIGQGISTQQLHGVFEASFMLKHNFFLDLSATIRKINSEAANSDHDTQFFQGGIRLNIPKRLHEF